MIKERDGVEYLVVSDANGHVEVGKGRGIHTIVVDAAHGSTKHASGRIGHGRSERHYWTAPIVGRSTVRRRHMFCNV